MGIPRGTVRIRKDDQADIIWLGTWCPRGPPLTIKVPRRRELRRFSSTDGEFVYFHIRLFGALHRMRVAQHSGQLFGWVSYGQFPLRRERAGVRNFCQQGAA